MQSITAVIIVVNSLTQILNMKAKNERNGLYGIADIF